MEGGSPFAPKPIAYRGGYRILETGGHTPQKGAQTYFTLHFCLKITVKMQYFWQNRGARAPRAPHSGSATGIVIFATKVSLSKLPIFV